MKKSIIGVFTAAVIGLLGVMVSQANIYHELSHKVQSTADTVGCKYGQCNATAKSTGNRCRHCVSNEGDLYCWQH